MKVEEEEEEEDKGCVYSYIDFRLFFNLIIVETEEIKKKEQKKLWDKLETNTNHHNLIQ